MELAGNLSTYQIANTYTFVTHTICEKIENLKQQENFKFISYNGSGMHIPIDWTYNKYKVSELVLSSTVVDKNTNEIDIDQTTIQFVNLSANNFSVSSECVNCSVGNTFTVPNNEVKVSDISLIYKHAYNNDKLTLYAYTSTMNWGISSEIGNVEYTKGNYSDWKDTTQKDNNSNYYNYRNKIYLAHENTSNSVTFDSPITGKAIAIASVCAYLGQNVTNVSVTLNVNAETKASGRVTGFVNDHSKHKSQHAYSTKCASLACTFDVVSGTTYTVTINIDGKTNTNGSIVVLGGRSFSKVGGINV